MSAHVILAIVANALPRRGRTSAPRLRKRNLEIQAVNESGNAMLLVNIASVMYTSIGFIDVLGIVSAAAHLRHGASRCNTQRLLVGITIGMCWVGQSGYSRLLAVLVVRSTVSAVRNWSGGTSHSSFI